MCSYRYLSIEFACNGAWNAQVKKVIDSGRTKLNQLHSVISNRSINLSARRMLLLAVVRPSLEYGNEVWECNKGQANSIILEGAKKILGCSSRTCNEAVRGDIGIDTLMSHRDKAKLKWWYKLASMPEDRYSKQLFSQEWNIKPRRGRQRKTWGRVVDDLFVALGIDKGEYLHDVEGGDSSVASFMARVEECISERECKLCDEGLNSKVKLSLYRMFSKKVGLHGVSDAGSRLLFKFRSGTHGLNEGLGRHRGREGKVQCTLCGAECESVVHVLWECPAYSNC